MKRDELMIAVAFDLNFRHAAEIFGGVSDYVSANTLNWRLVPLNFGFEARMIDLAKSGKLNGAIGTFISDGWVSGITDLGVKTVNLFNFSKIETIPSVGIDDETLGKLAAEHFKEQGAKRFAFFGADGLYYTRLRKKGYEAVVNSSVFEITPGARLEEQLAQIKLSGSLVGIFCSSDALAKEIILVAEHIGFQTGRDFLIVGIDNDPSESIFAGIGISSFKIPARKIGNEAASILHRSLISNQKQVSIVCDSTELMPREFSLASARARIVQQTIDRMRERLTEPTLEIEALAREAGISRRGLEIAFQEQLKESPYKLLSQMRATEGRALLQQTEYSINEVGRRIGYPGQHHFSAWFKKIHGMSPKKFRESQRT